MPSSAQRSEAPLFPAARNICRARGIAGSAIDFLICAIAHLRGWEVFTADRDFIRYRKVLPLKLY